MELITDCKCSCANCGEVIEYRSNQRGNLIKCPKCGLESLLPEPEKLMLSTHLGPEMPEFKNCPVCGMQLKFLATDCSNCEKKRSSKNRLIFASVGITLVVVGVIVVWYLNKPAPVHHSPPHMFIAEPLARMPKSINDLRASGLALERNRGETAATAVCDILNDSDYVHTHLRADLYLLDKKGTKIGTVSDFFVNLGAHQTWHFVATVKDPNAVSVRLAGIKDEE